MAGNGWLQPGRNFLSTKLHFFHDATPISMTTKCSAKPHGPPSTFFYQIPIALQGLVANCWGALVVERSERFFIPPLPADDELEVEVPFLCVPDRQTEAVLTLAEIPGPAVSLLICSHVCSEETIWL